MEEVSEYQVIDLVQEARGDHNCTPRKIAKVLFDDLGQDSIVKMNAFSENIKPKLEGAQAAADRINRVRMRLFLNEGGKDEYKEQHVEDKTQTTPESLQPEAVSVSSPRRLAGLHQF